jgi:hypothetical protein
MTDNLIPNDPFSRRRRELGDNPGAVGASSTIHVQDFYGNGESWILETFRAGKDTTVFIQCSSVSEPFRRMLPPPVVAALLRHAATIDTRLRKRAARQAAATRKARGFVPNFAKKLTGT